jgi:hypothetical protein
MKLVIKNKSNDRDWKFCSVFIPTLIGTKTDIRHYKNKLIIVPR